MSSYDAAVAADVARVPAEARETPKLTPAQAGYTDDESDTHWCSLCWLWIRLRDDGAGAIPAEEVGRCAIVAGEIQAGGTCNFWKRGRPMAKGRAAQNSALLGQIEAGYMFRPTGFRCAACRRFHPPADAAADARAPGTCEVVYGAIRPQGCCNVFSDGRPWVEQRYGHDAE